MININLESYKKSKGIAFFQSGFRPFFLLAAFYAILAMTFWGGIYLFQWKLPLHRVSSMTWHAHEMVFGYGMAVIAGFLLTAVRNWTKQQTADGILLAYLMILWILGRIPPINLPIAYLQEIADVSFNMVLIFVIAKPLYIRKMKVQWVVVVVLFALFLANIGYYMSVFQIIELAPSTFVYIGLFTILNLLFVFGRRLIPNFTNSALRPKVEIKNRDLIDKVLMPLFLIFSINEVVFQNEILTFGLSTILFILNTIRVIDWYRPEIWKNNLIWSLWFGYTFLTLGFLVKMGEFTFAVSPFLGIHMFAVGGLGMIATSMMARVGYGHSGRNIFNMTPAVRWSFIGIILAVIFRVIFPIFFPSQYTLWIGIAMTSWIFGFATFFLIFFYVFVKARPDGAYG